MIKFLLKASNSNVLIADLLNRLGAQLGDPALITDLTDMRNKYFEILGHLDRNGCNFALIMAGLVNQSLEELTELKEKRDAGGIN